MRTLEEKKLVKKRVAISLTIFSLFFLFIFNVQASDLNERQELLLKTSITAPVKFVEKSSGANLQYLKINYSWIPVTDYRQEFISYESSPIGVMNNSVLLIERDTMQDFDLRVNLETRSYSKPVMVKSKVTFPLKGLDSSVLEYTLPSGKADTNDAIKEKAVELAAGEDDLYVVVFNLADWVNSNVEYNLSSSNVDASYPSSWVFENKQGVCDEISNLFISMCRSLGIPARFVSGIAYTDDTRFENSWGAHGWAEVYFPEYGWVPFDPTYDQLGYVDATHIKFHTKSEDNKDALEYVWLGKNIDIRSESIGITGTVLKTGEPISPDFSINVEFMQPEVGLGYYNVVQATIQNKRDYYVAASVAMSRTEGLTVVGEEKQDIILHPNERKIVYWIVKVNELNPDFIYTFPVTIYSDGERNTSKFQSTSGGSKISLKTAQNFVSSHEISVLGPVLKCSSSKSMMYQNEKVNITCSTDTEKYLKFCIESTCSSEKFLTIQKQFSTNELGFTTIKISATNELSGSDASYAFLSFNVLDQSKINVVANYSEKIKYADNSEIRIVLTKNSSSIPKNVSLKIENKLLYQVWNVDSLDDKNEFVLQFQGKNLKKGANNINIVVDYYDELGKKYSQEQSISIELYDLTFVQKVKVFFNSLI